MDATDGPVPEPRPQWIVRVDPVLRHHLEAVMRLDRGLRAVLLKEMERRYPPAPEGRAA